MLAKTGMVPNKGAVEHDTIPAEGLKSRDVYRLMTDLVAPRPIAWVSTLDEDGRRNLAPFSYFQGVCSRPPMVMLSISWHPDGRPKDTLRNILARREFTVSHVSEPLGQAMNVTSGDYPRDVSEWDIAGRDDQPLDSAPAVRVAPPRVRQARAALECRLVHALPLGRGPAGKPSSTLVLGEVILFSVARGLLRRDERGHLLPMDPARLAAVGRLGGIAYTRTRESFEMARPKVKGS